VTTSSKAGGLAGKVAKLTNLAAQIDRSEKELEKLKAQFKALKASLV
jgi:cell division protein FtsB